MLKMFLLETVVCLLLYLAGFQKVLCENEQEKEDNRRVTRLTISPHIRITLSPKHITY